MVAVLVFHCSKLVVVYNVSVTGCCTGWIGSIWRVITITVNVGWVVVNSVFHMFLSRVFISLLCCPNPDLASICLDSGEMALF